MKYLLILLVSIVISFLVMASPLQANELNTKIDFNKNDWRIVKGISSTRKQTQYLLASKAKNARIFSVDPVLLTQQLLSKKTPIISVPLPDGQFIVVRLTSNSVMPNALAAKYPNIRSFNGVQIGAKTQYKGKFDITPQGFHGVLNVDGKQVFIEPKYRNNHQFYHSYFREDAKPLIKQKIIHRQKLRQYFTERKPFFSRQQSGVAVTEISAYRLAVSATGEYTAFHGGTKNLALAAIVTMVNRINQVYLQDVSVQFSLVAQNDAIIFTDAATDPFDNTDNDIDANADVINAAIGENNYDIGHVVGTGGGGLAGLGVVCSAFKAQGVTGSPVPSNDAFYIDLVAHEIGHQFNANHSFNGTSGSCSGNRSASSAYEVGSASTIMGYAGICNAENLQTNSDPYFHIHSIDQITSFVQSDPSCGTHQAKSNQAPSVDAGSDFSIPARTAFILSGSANDAENDKLTYSWEEFDLGTASSSKLEAQTDDGSRPLFRNFIPKTSSERTLPQLSSLLNNSVAFGETFPTTARDLNFRLVVRDDQNNVNDDSVKVSVIASDTGFAIIEPSDSANWQAAQQTVTWFTANSELAPINCTLVNIWLSADSGNNFTLLKTNSPNDGSEQINLPTLNTSQGRIKVSCANEHFFAISKTDINIVSDGSSLDSKPEFIGQNTLAVDEDNSITLTSADFTFVNNLQVDTLVVAEGNNYQVIDNKITPNENFNGELTVPVTASKGQFISDVFMTSITVNAVNDLPIALNDSEQVQQDSVDNLFNVLANDSDIENDPLTIVAVEYTGTGSVTITDNNLIYTPAVGYSGTESFSYTVGDGSQGTSSANVSVVVNAKTIEVTNDSANKSSGGSVGLLLIFWLLVFPKRVLTSLNYIKLVHVKTLFSAVLLVNLMACGTFPHEKSLHKKSIQQKNIADTTALQQRVAAAITQAKQQNDTRLFATKGRRLVIPGVEPQYFSQIKQQCGIKFIENSGDVLTNQQDKVRRKADYLFSSHFNKVMFTLCFQ